MFRLAARAVRPAARGFATSTAAGENEFVARRTAIRQHAAGEYTADYVGDEKVGSWCEENWWGWE